MAERSLTVTILGDERDLLRAFTNSSKATQRFERQMNGVSRGLRNVFAVAGVSLGAAGVVRAVRDTISAAVDFESSFAGVRKTVDATEPQLQRLATGFREMSKEIPISVNELNRIGEAAGQLGIQRSAILDFTNTIAALGVTTNLASDEAADALARIANITQIPQDEFDNLGSTIVDLGNKLAATESEITDFGLRIAAAGKIVGLTVDETLAIAGAFTSVGVEAEAGGTAVSKVFIALANAVKSGGDQLQLFANTAGVSMEEFRRLFETNSSAAFTAFVEGLQRVDEEGGNVFKTLKDLGLTDARLTRAFLSISQGGDLLSRSLDIGAKAWRENSALTEEAAKRYDTTASKLTLFKNRVNDLQITLGNVLAPALLDIIEPLGEWAAKTENQKLLQDGLIQTMKDLGSVLEGVREVVEPLAKAIKTLADQMGGLDEAVKLLIISMAAGKIVGFTTSLLGLGTAAAGTTTKVKLLRAALTKLLPFAVLVFSIEFLTNYDKIQGVFTDILRKVNLISDPPTTKIGKLEALERKLYATALLYGKNSDEVHRLRGEIALLARELDRLPELPGDRAEGPTGPGFGRNTKTKVTGTSVKETTELLANNAKIGDAIIAKITRQVAGQDDLNRKLRESETRAAHLRDLIRADPGNATLQQRLRAELATQATLQEQIATEAEAAAQAQVDAAAAVRAQVIAMFDLREAQAGLTASLQDNLKVAKEREESLRNLAALNRGDLDIALQLVNATAARRDIEQEIAEKKRTARTARQFEILGLTATGEKRAPGIDALIGRGESLEKQVKGTFLDTPATKKKFAAIARVLAEGPKEVGREMRLAILAMFNEIADALDQGTKKTGPLTKASGLNTKKILAGLGLSADEANELRGRLSGVNSAGFQLSQGTGAGGGFARARDSGISIDNYVTVEIDGAKVAGTVTKQQQKQRRRNPRQKRGPNRTGGV